MHENTSHEAGNTADTLC